MTGNRLIAVGHLETNRQGIAARHAAGRHQAAEADTGAGQDMLLDDIAGRIEEHDGILQGAEHQQHRNRKDTETRTNQDNAALLPRHRSMNSLYFPAVAREAFLSSYHTRMF